MASTDTSITLPAEQGFVSVDNTPHPADVVDTGLAHRRYAIAVTDEHGLQVKELNDPDQRTNPHRVEGTRTVTELASFLHELNRRPLSEETGTLWGNASRGSIVAIYNDHEGGPNSAELAKDDRLAGWRDDRLELKLPAHPDWVRWHEISGKYFGQEQFGDIVEDLRHTIVAPDQADLLEIIDSVRGSTGGDFESSIDRARGGLKVAYKKEVNARAGAVGRELEVPQHIKLSITPWDGHTKLYDVNAYFRLNITEGHLKLAVKLFPTRETVRVAWAELTADITAAIGKPVYAQP
ncbi:DUF2303 family protein [Mycobacterium sp. PSTR-4-N]|uniref:DUF2303 family protein n=1 Tax=Mycobacterium sp. PSTR-4-N TaxID=2917745 RepID=UPI001F151915|nr:DUF2303 family protein [Mycobacterium sp. PSTR-4-N]MCG7592428.1 DUF2303 family protein [Mycobacterium sp. PSTR-4-N]